MKSLGKDRRFAVYSACESFNKPIEVHKEVKSKNVAFEAGKMQVTASSEIGAVTNRLDWLSWLPSAAAQYNTSTDPNDYVLLPTIICPSDIPNRNGVAFPLQELLRFDVDTHRMAYQNWKGCPTFLEHDNEDHTKAKGMVLDAVLRKAHGYQGNIHKVLGLAAFDRTRDPALVHRLLTRELKEVSMGAMVDTYTCSVCGREIGECRHLDAKRPRDFYLDSMTGKLVHRCCVGIYPFELSAVAVPAWTVAESTHTIDLARGV